MRNEFKKISFLKRDAKRILDENGVKPSVWSSENIGFFAKSAYYSLSLILKEKEIILFSILQWVAIAIVYYIWVQIFSWIPNEVWESESKMRDLTLNIAFAAWSFLCVAIAAYPIGVLTGAMGAAHFLREQGYKSTVAACLKVSLTNSKSLWVFQIIDGWLTVDIILERLPKRGYFARYRQRKIYEAIYYAWKVGTVGFVPAALVGNGLAESGKESIRLLKNNLLEVLMLRGGYSVVCWLIGVTTYFGSIWFFSEYNFLFKTEDKMFVFYFWMGVPILLSVGVIKLFVRPIYVISSCKLYSDYLIQSKVNFELADMPSRGKSAFITFLITCVIFAVIFLYREPLGLMHILSVS